MKDIFGFLTLSCLALKKVETVEKKMMHTDGELKFKMPI